MRNVDRGRVDAPVVVSWCRTLPVILNAGDCTWQLEGLFEEKFCLDIMNIKLQGYLFRRMAALQYSLLAERDCQQAKQIKLKSSDVKINLNSILS